MTASSARGERRAMARARGPSCGQRASAAMGVSLLRGHHLDLRRAQERLQDGAVALGPAHQSFEVLLARVGSVDLEAHADRVEPGRDLAVDAERAAEVEVALDVHLDLA